MYWDMVVKEVLNKHNPSCRFIFTHRDDHLPKAPKAKLSDTETAIRKYKMENYSLGAKYPGISFTRREAECMVQMLKGKTISKVALALALSPRTVEFYLKKMKTKLDCHTKFELVEKVLDSDFMKNVDF